MYTTTQMDVFDTLCEIMRQFPDNYNAETKYRMEALFASCVEDMETDSQKLLATLLIKALNKKIHSESIGENIYLNKYEISQIQLFNILIEKFPFVKYSQQITNNAILEVIRQNTEVTIIDIGIGQGTQMVNVIESAKQLTHLKKMVIVGIEPFEDALRQAETVINSYAGKVPFEIEFTGIHGFAENVDFSAIPQLSGAVIVNASLALHHIQSARQRSETIARIKKINPAAFILIEPNVNHYEPDFYTRFINCYNHFYSIFQVIDRIDISQNDKNALKLFFGREIEDIIGKEEKDRYEKHEPATHWIGRLRENNFSVKNEFLHPPVRSVYGVEIDSHAEGFLGFTFEKETVLAVIYAN
ncbi:MAG: hypothetical protein EP344_04290 [Bacteroidetes bacterium]|nr:MAG: hypothetical protein EP344_04290 [Bacteroidota bacterium]